LFSRNKVHALPAETPAWKNLLLVCGIIWKVNPGVHLGTTKRWKEILASFESQNGICYYSGIKLIIGKNASLDHKIPKSKHGIEDGVYDAGNLVWCDKMVNIMKNSMTDDEFIAMCKKITDYCQSEPAEPRRLRRTKKQELLGLITI
jgi:hypothetical protein